MLSSNKKPRGSFVSLVVRALRGEEMDYTTGSLRKAVFMLAIPMMLEMAMESVFAIVDLYFVGHLDHSEDAIQAVGLTESVLTIIYSLAIGMSMAATAMVARRVGEKNYKEAGHSGVQVLLVATVITIVLSLLGIFFAADILELMGAEPATVERGTTFTRIMMGSSTIIMLLFLINGIFRGAGNAAIAMKSLLIANLANIILCPIFIRGLGPIPAMGLTGAAVATVIGRSLGVVYQLFHLFKGSNKLKILVEHWTPDKELIRSIVKIAAPAILQFVIASCSWIFLARLVAEAGGSVGSAGYQTALRIMMFFMLPAWGLSNAAATLVGQNLGANELERAERSVMTTMKINVIYMLFVTLVFVLIGHWVVAFFAENKDIQAMGYEAMKIMSIGYVFYGVGMVLINAFNGAGDTWTPTYINLFGFWCFQIPLAYLLANYWEMGPKGVFIAVPVAEMLITVISFIVFKRGKWKQVKV